LEVHQQKSIKAAVEEDSPILTIERWERYDKLFNEFKRMCFRGGSLRLDLGGMISRWILTQKLVESPEKQLDPVFSVCGEGSTFADAGVIHELEKAGLSKNETCEIVKMLKDESCKHAIALNERKAKLHKHKGNTPTYQKSVLIYSFDRGVSCDAKEG